MLEAVVVGEVLEGSNCQGFAEVGLGEVVVDIVGGCCVVESVVLRLMHCGERKLERRTMGRIGAVDDCRLSVVCTLELYNVCYFVVVVRL